MPKRKLSRKDVITQRWGWAKRTFIENQIRSGSSHANAVQLWIIKRQALKDFNVAFPADEHIQVFAPGQRGPYEEADWEEEDIAANTELPISISDSESSLGNSLTASELEQVEYQAYLVEKAKQDQVQPPKRQRPDQDLKYATIERHPPDEQAPALRPLYHDRHQQIGIPTRNTAIHRTVDTPKDPGYFADSASESSYSLRTHSSDSNVGKLQALLAEKAPSTDTDTSYGSSELYRPDVSDISSYHSADSGPPYLGPPHPLTGKSTHKTGVDPAPAVPSDSSSSVHSDPNTIPRNEYGFNSGHSLGGESPAVAEMSLAGSFGLGAGGSMRPSDGGDQPMGSDGGASDPGRNESRGGSGGGLAGAGNNMMFKGFAGSTKPKRDKPYTYEETFKRPFAIHTEFQTTDVNAAATIHLTPVPVLDLDEVDNEEYERSYLMAECDHGGVMVPYMFMECSMKDRDWNKPNDHIGYKVVEFGFNIPNLRLSVMNNERADVTAVAPAPPADARMWMFIDTNNDYGLVMSHQNSGLQHSDYFREEDISKAEFGRYNLPQLGRRYFLLPKTEGMMIAGDRNWTQPDQTKVESTDPNCLYDMKRHDGYKEFVLSEASLGCCYKTNAPVVRFPHPPNTSFDHCMKQQGLTDSASQGIWTGSPIDPTPDLHYWTTTYQQIIEANPQTGIAPADIMQAGEVNYYMANVSDYFGEMADNYPFDPAGRQLIRQQDYVGSTPVKPRASGNMDALTLTGQSSKVRALGRSNISDEGSHHATAIAKRPPIFTFGIHKELEDQAAQQVKFWRYYAYGQVEYYCKIKWYVNPERYKSYIPIGPGGVYQYYEDMDQDEAIDPTYWSRKQQLLQRKQYRRGMNMLTNSTAYENVQNQQFYNF